MIKQRSFRCPKKLHNTPPPPTLLRGNFGSKYGHRASFGEINMYTRVYDTLFHSTLCIQLIAGQKHSSSHVPLWSSWIFNPHIIHQKSKQFWTALKCLFSIELIISSFCNNFWTNRIICIVYSAIWPFVKSKVRIFNPHIFHQSKKKFILFWKIVQELNIQSFNLTNGQMAL